MRKEAEDLTVKVHCKYCRDKGIKGGCPKCGKEQMAIPETILQKHGGVTTDDTVVAVIPEFYRGRLWDKNTLIMDHKELDGLSKFNNYANQLERVHNMFAEGIIPNKSAIIIAPRKFSKQTWANSCIQLGMKTGHKMLPVMSSNILKMVMANTFDRPHASFLKEIGYNIEDIITADCLFVNIDSGYQHTSAYAFIDELMCLRSQFDRPTIFLSRFSIDEITKTDYDKTFIKAIDSSNDVNRLRYPVIIQCDER